ncbi:MAG: type II secretion system protein [Planctomycetota bacterium]|jgi:prepilin-type N-terminal cleavage/methylation domain-containing protein|nr:type II secretion system protein [Planctomycetota bacterium]
MRRCGFTLIELIIAMALGIAVLFVATAAVRMAMQTMQAANRLSVQNQVMRTGFLLANEEIDFWTGFDEPVASSQPLRGTVDRGLGRTGPDTTYALPFTELTAIPPPNELASGGRGFAVDSIDPLVYRETVFRDTAHGGSLLLKDRQRGFDQRPYQANDPRRWYRGQIMEPDSGERKCGRYGLVSNRHLGPVLGFGDDHRALGNFSQRVPRDGHKAPGVQILTGPYGPYGGLDWDLGSGGALKARTFTWYENQTVYAFEALGTYGMFDYLPSNHWYRSYGGSGYIEANGGTPEGDYATGIASGTIAPVVDRYVRIDERPDLRFRGFITNANEPWYVEYQSLGRDPSTFATSFGSVALNDWFAFQIGKDANGTAYSQSSMIWRSHRSLAGPERHWFEYVGGLRETTWVRNLLADRPSEWPALRMELQRGVLRGRQFNLARVRWTDLQSNEEQEVVVTSLGTSFRGARQQRARGGGWAAWYAPGDSRNSPHLDTPP